MGSPLRSTLLSFVIFTEIIAMGLFWNKAQAQDRWEQQSCASMRHGITDMLSTTLGADEPDPAAFVDHILRAANVERRSPVLPGRPLVRQVHGLNLVPGPEMNCTVYVMTDPEGDRIVVRQYLDGTVHEVEISPTVSPWAKYGASNSATTPAP